jgi:uncharacterized damage-inducible protein DinB
MRALVLTIAAAALAFGQQQADARWGRIRTLAGRWEGTSEGKPGTGRTVREYRLDLNGRVLSGTNTVTYAKETHEDRSVFTYDRGRKEIALRQFHVEGFVNEYRTGGAGAADSIQFTSFAIDNIPEGWRARETYTFRGPDEVIEVFELAAPGKDFETYSRTTLRRAGAATAASTGELLPMKDFIEQWRISKEFTIAVAEKMPAEHYDFKPTPEQFSFAEQMAHLAMSSLYRFAQLTGEQFKPPAKDLSKPAVIRLLNESFDYVLAKLPSITAEQTTGKTFDVKWEGRPVANGREMMLNMFMHVAHHRAQAEVYMRLKGIAPPTYRF